MTEKNLLDLARQRLANAEIRLATTQEDVARARDMLARHIEEEKQEDEGVSVTARAGSCYENVWLIDIHGEEHQGCMIVARTSAEGYAQRRKRITFWRPEMLTEHGLHGAKGQVVVADYHNVRIDKNPIKGVE